MGRTQYSRAAATSALLVATVRDACTGGQSGRRLVGPTCTAAERCDSAVLAPRRPALPSGKPRDRNSSRRVPRGCWPPHLARTQRFSQPTPATPVPPPRQNQKRLRCCARAVL